MRVTMGIDSGMTKIGFGVVKDGELLDFGLWAPSSKEKQINAQVVDKLRNLYPEAVEKIKQHGVTHLAVELVPIRAMAQRDKVIAVQNMFRIIAIVHGLHYREIAATSAKKLATGDGRASKSDIRHHVYDTWPDMRVIEDIPADVYDGIMIASVSSKLEKGWWEPVG